MTTRLMNGDLPAHLPLEAMKDLHGRWGLFLALGIVLIVLGLIGVSASTLFTLVSVVVLGWLLVVAGSATIVHAFWASRWSGFFLQLLAGLLYLIVGWMLAARPGVGAEALTLLMAISLTLQGAFRLGAALGTRVDGRGPLLLSGAITSILGLMIWNQWPVSGLWVIGLFTGVDMIMYGFWVVSIALAARKLRRS